MFKKKGTILAENVIFIVLNLVFISILILFLFSKMGSAAVLEEKYAKQIALVIDSAKPGMKISINMEDAVKEANKEEWKGKIVDIQDNIVTVRMRDGVGYSYSFFNDVDFDKLYLRADENKNNFEFEVMEKNKLVEDEGKDEA